MALTIAIFIIIFRLLYEWGARTNAEEEANKNIKNKRSGEK